MNGLLHAKSCLFRPFEGLNYSVFLLLLGVITLSACSDHQLPPPLLGQEQSPTDTHKRIALLAMMADINYDLVAASEAELQQNTLKINQLLQTNADAQAFLGTDWQVVWGPALSNSKRKSATSPVDSFVTDNAMYVARGTDLATGKPLYVVAIAGTNAVSRNGALFQDLNVVEEKDWPTLGGGKISAGSLLGFNNLNAMRDANSGQTLLEFLATLSKAGPGQVAFTGHSLGGALAPLMALKAIEWQQQTGSTSLTVSAYPIAGPTPGDGVFAGYAARKFGDAYHSVINTHDIVPHAWQKDQFAQIPSLYKQAPPFNPGGAKGFSLPSTDQLAYDALKLSIDKKTYQRIAPEREFVFSGTPNVYPDGSGSYFQEAKYQHTIAYYKEAFGFPQPIIDALAH
ncbi:lipase family protein [Spirosoma koreense]